MWICPILLFALARLHLSPPFHSRASSTFPLSGLGRNVPLSWRSLYLWSIAAHTHSPYVLSSTESQFNTLLYTLRPLRWGHRTKLIVTHSIFLHYRGLTSVYETGRQSALLWFMPFYQRLLDPCCSFDVIFQCQHSVLSMNRLDIQILHPISSSVCLSQHWSDWQGGKWVLGGLGLYLR